MTGYVIPDVGFVLADTFVRVAGKAYPNGSEDAQKAIEKNKKAGGKGHAYVGRKGDLISLDEAEALGLLKGAANG